MGAAQNARAQGPEAALTGPVVRGDGAAIAAHVEALRKYPEALALYTTLTTELRRLAVRGTSDTTMADVA